jgi:hypothetical protein
MQDLQATVVKKAGFLPLASSTTMKAKEGDLDELLALIARDGGDCVVPGVREAFVPPCAAEEGAASQSAPSSNLLPAAKEGAASQSALSSSLSPAAEQRVAPQPAPSPNLLPAAEEGTASQSAPSLGLSPSAEHRAASQPAPSPNLPPAAVQIAASQPASSSLGLATTIREASLRARATNQTRQLQTTGRFPGVEEHPIATPFWTTPRQLPASFFNRTDLTPPFYQRPRNAPINPRNAPTCKNCHTNCARARGGRASQGQACTLPACCDGTMCPAGRGHDKKGNIKRRR